LVATAAETISIDLSTKGYENAQEITTVTQGAVTLTFDKGSGSNTPKYYTAGTAVRAYGGNTITVAATSNIVSIEFLYPQAAAKGVTASTGTLSTAEDNLSAMWTGSASEVTFTLEAGSGQNRYRVINITLGEQGEVVVAKPTFNPAGGTYYAPVQVALSCGTAGADIHYTIDGSTPTTNNAPYTAPIYLSTNTTIKAVAFYQGKASEVAEATYEFAEATGVANIAAFNATDDGTQVVFNNPVSVLAHNSNNLYVRDNTGYMLIYGKSKASGTYKNGDVIPAGFMGKRTTYNGEPELQVADASSFGEVTENSPIEAEEIQCADVSAELWGHYVLIKNATLSKTEDNKWFITDNSGQAAMHTGMGGYGSSTDLTKTYNVYAIVGAYRPADATETTYQVLPVKLEDPSGSVEPVDGISIAEFQTQVDDAEVTFKNPATVLAQSGQRLFVRDETGYMLVFGNVGQTYETGNVIPAGFGGVKTTWDGEPELKTPKNFKAATSTVQVTPETFAEASHETFGHYVVFKSVTFDTEAGTISDGTLSAPYFCNMGADVPADLTKKYDVYAIVGSHGKAPNTVYQLLPVKIVLEGGGEVEVPTVNSLEELYAMPKGAKAKLGVDLTAVFQSGSNLYAKVGDDFTLVYGRLTNKFDNGDIIRDAEVSWTEYNGNKQLVPTDETFVKAASGDAVQPEEMPIEELGQDMIHQYFVIRNATVTATETDRTYMIADETGEVKLFDNKFVDMPETLEGKTFDVEVFLTVYKQEIELYPVKFTDLSVPELKKGDIDGNDAVDVQDLSLLIDVVLGKRSATDPAIKGDIHLAGKTGVDVQDISILIDLVLGK
jgi:hypothetical protein